MKFEDFKSEIEKIDSNLIVERYDEDQIVMIGLTLQDRKAGDIDIFIKENVPAFKIITDEDGNRLFKVEIGFDVTCFSLILKVINLVKEYMKEEQEQQKWTEKRN